MLLLRGVFALSLLAQGQFYLRAADGAPVMWLVGLAALAAGMLLLLGFLTPVAGAVTGVGAIAVALSALPSCTPSLFDSKLAFVFAVTMLIGIVSLGPGAFSLDARIFGRREIIIPPSASPSHRQL